MGPIQNKTQFERVMGLIESARTDGKIIAGGERQGEKGYFIKPTIVRDITDGSRLVDEEQFGPVLPVIRYSDPEDALARANNSEWGLGGSIWSTDLDQAYDLATKGSGIGVELGEEGLAEFTQLQVINVAR
jgi:acyl-CoA reductase-like NAD-dependent aldehyde dehydrogenase